MEKIRAFHTGLVARTMDALAKVPEGDGTMLDRTVIVYLSDAVETYRSRCFEWPMVVIGDAGGRLKRGGHYLQFPNHGPPRPPHHQLHVQPPPARRRHPPTRRRPPRSEHR